MADLIKIEFMVVTPGGRRSVMRPWGPCPPRVGDSVSFDDDVFGRVRTVVWFGADSVRVVLEA